MLKKSITYTNPFTDEQVTEEHYFHLSKADLVEIEMEEHGNEYRDKEGNQLTGAQAKLQRIIDSEDGKAIMAEFKDMIRRSYGRKEGDRFLKSQQIWEEFSSTEAYAQLIFELCTDAGKGAEFFNGVVPNNMDQIAAEIQQIASDTQAAKDAADPTGLTSPTPPAQPVSASSDALSERQGEIARATSENPVLLTRPEIIAMDEETLRDGLATGRFKLAPQ